MVKELTKDVALFEATKIDTVASDACTRSGTFALLLSLALVALIPYWEQEREETALGRYFNLRLNLATSIKQLDDNPYWQQYKTSHEEAESTSIEQLLKVSVETPPSEGHTKPVQPTPSTPTENKTKQDVPLVPSPPTLSPPTGVHLSIEIAEIHQIASFLRGLNDSELLTNSRKVSGFYDYSIYLWVLKQRSLIAGNRLKVDGIPTVELPSADEKEHVMPVNDKEGLVKYLTLHDVRELVQFQLPEIKDTTKLGGRSGKEIDIALGSLPRNLYGAAAYAETLLLFVVMYFYAFTREAVSSATFPALGTLFSAFSRSHLTLAVFFIALCSPVAASLCVAVASHELSLMVYTILIGCAVFLVLKALSFRFFIHSKRVEKDASSSGSQASNQISDLSTVLSNKLDPGDA